MAMNRPDDFRLGPVGRPLPGNGSVITENSEITVRGPGLFGYLGEEDHRRLDSDGFYHTGDLGGFDQDGYLSVSGRSDDMFKTSTGRRVAPAGIKARLRSVFGIDQAVLVGSGRKCLVALCTCMTARPDEQTLACSERELRERVAAMGDHERPRAIALIELPFSIERGELTANLKLRRAAIEQAPCRRDSDALSTDRARGVGSRRTDRHPIGTLRIRTGWLVTPKSG